MPWVDDVIPHTTIRSVWGNSIRDRVVHQFANRAERDGAGVHPVNGMLCITLDTACVWIYSGAAGRWVPFSTPWKSWSPVNLSGVGYNVNVASAAAQWRYDSPRSVQVQCEAAMPTGIPGVSGPLYCTLPSGLGAGASASGGFPMGEGTVTNFRTGLGMGAVVRGNGNLPQCYFGLPGVGPNRELVNAAFGTINLWESSQWGVSFRAAYQADLGPSDFL